MEGMMETVESVRLVNKTMASLRRLAWGAQTDEIRGVLTAALEEARTEGMALTAVDFTADIVEVLYGKESADKIRTPPKEAADEADS